jgi:hypothetical protein
MVGRMLAVVAVLGVGLGGCGKSNGHAHDAGAAADLAAPADLTLFGPECDVLANSGCPAGQRCTTGTQDGQPRDLCFALAAAPLAEGFPCLPVVDGTRIGDDCAAGLVCMTLAGTDAVCRRPCYQRADCAAGQGCTVPSLTSTLRTDDGGVFVLRGCNTDVGCDPIAQNVCFFGTACYLSTYDDVGRISECLLPGTGQVGASCAIITDCAPGFRCDGLGICRRYCYYAGASAPNGSDGGASSGCPDGEGVCDLFIAGGTYGICGAE